MFQPAFHIDLDIDPLWCSWFVGFCDGESHFGIVEHSARRAIEARLIIQLREDDRNILEEIKGVLRCGHVYSKSERRRGKPSPYRKNGVYRAKNSAEWKVTKIINLRMILVPLFDEYPLKSKKANDYVIWREAVCIMHASGGSNRRYEELKILSQRIKEVRRYSHKEKTRPSRAATGVWSGHNAKPCKTEV